MAGYCSNLSWSFWLIYPANKAQWQVWQLFRNFGKEQQRAEVMVGV
jgi:hypothetical protein